jgi:hypothetical protein
MNVIGRSGYAASAADADANAKSATSVRLIILMDSSLAGLEIQRRDGRLLTGGAFGGRREVISASCIGQVV